MWEIWTGQWSRTFLDGEVFLPLLWKLIPFLTWADEAPTMRVQEKDGRVEVSFSEEITEAWHVCLGNGLPVVFSDCTPARERKTWTGEGDFDSVWLISDMTDQRIGISIAYQRTDEFRPSSPVLEWGREEDGEVLGFSCYGWGTTRSFQGGMYAIASDQMAFYAEYDAEGALKAWYDGLTGCQYNEYDELIEGEEPEGYVCPVVH